MRVLRVYSQPRYAKLRIEQKNNCKVNMNGKAGKRLCAEAMHALKHLSMLTDADFGLEAFLPEGPDGPEIDVGLKFTRDHRPHIPHDRRQLEMTQFDDDPSSLHEGDEVEIFNRLLDGQKRDLNRKRPQLVDLQPQVRWFHRQSARSCNHNLAKVMPDLVACSRRARRR